MFYVFLVIVYVFIVMKLLFLILFKVPRPISGCERYRIGLLSLLLLVNPFSYQCIKSSLTSFNEMMRHKKIIRRGVDFRPLPYLHLMIFGQGHNHDVIRLFKHVKITECTFHIWNTCVLCIRATMHVKNFETLECDSPSPVLIWVLQSSQWAKIRSSILGKESGTCGWEQKCKEWM